VQAIETVTAIHRNCDLSSVDTDGTSDVTSFVTNTRMVRTMSENLDAILQKNW